MATLSVLAALQAELRRVSERQRDLGQRIRLEQQQAHLELGHLRAATGDLVSVLWQFGSRPVIEGEGSSRVVHAPEQAKSALAPARAFARELGEQLSKAAVLADYLEIRDWMGDASGGLVASLPRGGASNKADATAAEAVRRPERALSAALSEFAVRVTNWERLSGQLESVNGEIAALEERLQAANAAREARVAAAAAWAAMARRPDFRAALDWKADATSLDGLGASRIRIGAQAKALAAAAGHEEASAGDSVARAAADLSAVAASLAKVLEEAKTLAGRLKADELPRSVQSHLALHAERKLEEQDKLPDIVDGLEARARDVRRYESLLAEARGLVATASGLGQVRLTPRRPAAAARTERPAPVAAVAVPTALGGWRAGTANAPAFSSTSSRPARGSGSGSSPAGASAAVDPLLSFLDARAAKANRRASLAEQFAKARELEERENRLTRQIARIEQASLAARPLASKSTARIQTALARLDAGIALAKSEGRRPRAQGQRAVGVAMGELAAAAAQLGLRSSPSVRQLQTAIQERRDAIARVALGLDPEGPVSAEQASVLDALGEDVPGMSRLLRGDKARSTKARGRARGGGRLGGQDDGKVARLAKAFEGRDRRSALEALHPGAGVMQKQVDAMLGDLRSRGYPVRRKSWFSSALSSVTSMASSAVQSGLGAVASVKSTVSSGLSAVSKSVSGGLSAIQQGATSGLAFVKQTASSGLALAKNAGSSALAAATKLGAGALEKVQSAKKGVLALAQQARSGALGMLDAAKSGALETLHKAQQGAAWIKGKASRTASTLSAGAGFLKDKLGEAAAKAWDLGKQGVRAVGNASVGAWNAAKSGLGTAWTMAKNAPGAAWGLAKSAGQGLWRGAQHLYQATGNTLSGAWKSATGIVGAGMSGIKKGLSWVGDRVGEGAKKLGGVLLMHPGINAMWKVAKWAGPKIASFGKAAWEGAKTLGGKAANFLQSPAGQLLTTGLSIAASFIPGGLIVKAGIGAVMGAVEAVAKGGGLKEALMGAAVGGIEGAVPFLKLGLVGKLALGGVKGGLTAVMNGGGIGDVAKGALGGAFETGGLGMLKKFGGGRGVKMLGNFMSGSTQATSGLGKLIQKGTSSGVVQKMWGFGQKLAPKLVKGAVWLHDKSGKLHNVLESAHTAGEYVQHALSGVSGLTAWGAEKLGDGWGKDALSKLSGWAGAGAEKLEGGLEKLETVDKWVDTVHTRLGQGLKLIGVNPKKAAKELHEQERQGKLRRELQRKHADKLKTRPGLFDRTLNVFEGAADKLGKRKSALSELADGHLRKLKQGLGKTEFGQALFKGGEKMVKAGLWAKGNLTVVEGIVSKGTEVGEKVQSAMKNLVLATEGAEEGQFGGGALKWIHESAAKLNGDLETGLKYATQVQGITHLTNSALGGALRLGGATEKEIAANDQKWSTWGGLEELEEENGEKQKRGWGKPGEVDEDGKVGSAWWAVAGEKYGDATEKVHGRLEKAFDKISGSDSEERKKKGELSALDQWRKDVERRYQEQLKRMAGHGTPAGKENEVSSSRWRAMMALAGQGEAEPKQDQELLEETAGVTTAHSQSKDWTAYEERQKAAGTAEVASPSSVSKDVSAELGPRFDAVVKREANEVEAAENAAHAQGGGAKLAGRPADAEVQEVHRAAMDLQVARATLEEAARSEAVKTGLPPKPAVHAAEYARVVTLLNKVDHLQKVYGIDLKSLRELLTSLGAFFNAGQAMEARSAQSQANPAAVATPMPAPAPAAPAEVPPVVAASALESLASDDGVVGAPQAPAPNALAAIEYGGVTDPFSPAEPAYFDRLRGMVLAAELRLAAELPRARALGAAGDLAKGDQIFTGLRRELQQLELEYDRLRQAGFTDPAVGDTLARYAARILGLRAQLEVPAAGAAPTGPEEASPVSEDERPADDPVSELLAAAGQTVGDWIDDLLGTGPKQPKAAAADGTYAGESVEDTYIGSGASTRPISEGLASNFRFDDAQPEGPTLTGELAGVGGALLGLGGSVTGAASEFGGLGQAAGRLGAQAGELLGGGGRNRATKAADRVGEFSNWLQAGAGKAGAVGGKLSTAGARVHAFGDSWRSKGLGKTIGKLFRKGKAGSAARDEAEAPVVDAVPYADTAQRLDGDVLGSMERFLGGRLGNVKIHTGRGAEYITRRFEAEAVTIRDHVFFAPGRYQPQTTEGRKLIAHELTHVMQRSRPNLDTATAEHEAHRAEAAYGTPGMETLDLSQPEADFKVVDMGGAEHNPNGIRTAKKTRSVTSGSGGMDVPVEGEELLDLVGERVYELLIDDLEEEHESR